MGTRYGRKLGKKSQAEIVSQFVAILVHMISQDGLTPSQISFEGGATITCVDSSGHQNIIYVSSTRQFVENFKTAKPVLDVELTVKGGYYSQFAQMAANAAHRIRGEIKGCEFNLDIASIDEVEIKGR